MAKQHTKLPAASRNARRGRKAADAGGAVGRFVRRGGLARHVATARRLAGEEFKTTAPPRLELHEDPETAEQWVEVRLSVAGEPGEVLRAYNRYTARWLASVPPGAVGKIRLAFQVV